MHCVCDMYLHSEHCVCHLLSVCVYVCTHVCISIHMRKHTAFYTPSEFPPYSPPWDIHTNSLAVLGQCVHLIARVALALKVAFVIDTDLAAGIWVLTLVNVCGEE